MLLRQTDSVITRGKFRAIVQEHLHKLPGVVTSHDLRQFLIAVDGDTRAFGAVPHAFEDGGSLVVLDSRTSSPANQSACSERVREGEWELNSNFESKVKSESVPELDYQLVDPDYPEPDSLLPGRDTASMLHEFTINPDPTYRDCVEIATYLDILMDHVHDSPRPHAVDLMRAREFEPDLLWWNSRYLPDWNKVTCKDYEPLWNLLKAEHPPTFAELHQVEASILVYAKRSD